MRGDEVVARGSNRTNRSRNVRARAAARLPTHRRRRALRRAERACAAQATRHAELEAVDARLAACGDSLEAAAFTECALPPAGLCAHARRHRAQLMTAGWTL